MVSFHLNIVIKWKGEFGCSHKPAVVYVNMASDTFLKCRKESSPSYLLHDFIQSLEGHLSLDSECHEERVDQPLSVHAASSCWPSGAASCDFSISDCIENLLELQWQRHSKPERSHLGMRGSSSVDYL